MRKGKLIVGEGIDGVGKTTQCELLKKKLEAVGLPVRVFDFPRYGTPPAGHPASFFVRKYLRKKEFEFEQGYGSATILNPYAASLLYAVDRFDAAFCREYRPNLIDCLEAGDIVLANRYTQSNIGHQASKIKEVEKRRAFIEWLLKTEYEHLLIPKPDLVLLFNMPSSVAMALKEQQCQVQGLSKDAHEENAKFLERSHWAYLEAAKIFCDSWVIINVVDRDTNRLLSVSEVHELAWGEVSRLLSI